MLLTQVPGATSFDSLKTVGGVLHGTFREACRARGLLDDDREAGDAMTEAEHDRMPSELRALFASFLIFHACTNPLELWNGNGDSNPLTRTLGHKAGMMEDLVTR